MSALYCTHRFKELRGLILGIVPLSWLSLRNLGRGDLRQRTGTPSARQIRVPILQCSKSAHAGGNSAIELVVVQVPAFPSLAGDVSADHRFGKH